jgi:hypothetical protein
MGTVVGADMAMVLAFMLAVAGVALGVLTQDQRWGLGNLEQIIILDTLWTVTLLVQS